MKKLGVILFILIMCSFVYAEDSSDFEIVLEHITREEGLGNQAVSGMIQDKFGFFWFATQGGLYSYDGRTYKKFRSEPFDDNSLIHNLIQTIYYDSDRHELWIGTYQGLSKYNIEDDEFTNYHPEDYDFLSPIIIAIEEDDLGYLWIGTLGGLSKFNRETETIINYDIDKSTVRDIYLSQQGILFIGSYDGLYFIEDDQLVKYDIDLPSDYVMYIDEYEKGLLTLGLFDGGILEVDYNQNITKHVEFEDNRVYTHYKDKNNILWVGTWGGGLFKYDGNIEKVDDYQFPSLSEDIIYSIVEDESGILWISTNGDGVYKYNERKKSYVKFYHDPNNDQMLMQGRVSYIYEDQYQNLWMIIYGKGINRYNPKTHKMDSFTIDHGLNKLSTCALDVDGNLLVASENELLYFDEDQKVFTKFLEFDTNLIYTLAVKNDILWVGTYDNGVFLYNLLTNELTHLTSDNSKLSNNTIYDIMIDQNGLVWIATSDGITRIDNDQYTVYKTDKERASSISSNIINAIYEDTFGSIWFASSGGGVSRWIEEDIFLNFTEKDGLSSNEVIGLLEDSYGRIWASTDSGISMIDPLTYEIVVYTPKDGIGAWEFSRAFHKGSDGNMYFGGNHGVTTLPSVLDTDYSQSPNLFITDVYLNNKQVEETLFYNGQTIKFNANDNSLRIEFTAIDYDDPKKILYNYKLSGYHSNWVRSGHLSFAIFDRLSPGRYTFEVYAETSKKLTSEKVTMSIHVLAPWYQSVYAYILYILLIFALILVVFKLKEGRVVKKKNDALNDLNKKLEAVNKELENISLTDALTGLYNRRYFNMEFLEELHLATRSKNFLTLMMVDIDDFKYYNDTYGHIVGDQLLIDLANHLTSVLPRKTDFIARLGGDEFAVVLYDTDENGAKILAKRLLDSVKEVTVLNEDGSITDHVNISIGVYNFIPNDRSTVNNSLKYADQALYQAKFQGKNQYFLYKNH